MAALRLYAIGIDEARDLVGATAATAERARADAAALFAAAAPAPRGRLRTRLFAGRRQVEPSDPTRPTTDDLETVLSGHYPTPERALPCWRVWEHLLACQAWGRQVLDLDERGLADFDFALARAGVPAEAGLAHVAGSDARIGLCPVPGLRVGYVPHSRARSAGRALATLEVSGANAAAVEALRNFLGQYAGWAADATGSGRPVPDLLAVQDTV